MAKILVIDDDRSIVDLIKYILEKEGYEVVIARNGKEGLTAARAEKPDLIVLDVMMPEMDGFSVSGELFKDMEMRQTPILILTAKAHSREIFALVPNVVLYMEKPFEPQTLAKNVRELLAHA